MEDVRPISNSEVQAFKSCRRRWYYGTHLGLRHRARDLGEMLEDPDDGETTARRLGTRVHEVLEAYYNGLAPGFDPPSALARALSGTSAPQAVKDTAEAGNLYVVDGPSALKVWDAITEQERAAVAGSPAEKKWLSDNDLGRLMVEGYFEWLAESGADATLSVLTAEEEVSVPLVFDGSPVTDAQGRPVHLVGKLDLKVRDEVSDRVTTLDHKTVSNLNDLPNGSDIAEQPMFYTLLDRMTNRDTPTTGVTYNMLRKTKRTSRAKPPFYGRYDVHYSDPLLRGFWASLTGTIRDLLAVEAALAQGTTDDRHLCYPRPSRDCEWICSFRSLCPMVTDDATDHEGFISEAFEQGDAYARYDTVAFP